MINIPTNIMHVSYFLNPCLFIYVSYISQALSYLAERYATQFPNDEDWPTVLLPGFIKDLPYLRDTTGKSSSPLTRYLSSLVYSLSPSPLLPPSPSLIIPPPSSLLLLLLPTHTHTYTHTHTHT
jgi:hypothetical protein